MSKLRSKVVSSAMAVVLALGLAPGFAFAGEVESAPAATPLTLSPQTDMGTQAYVYPEVVTAPVVNHGVGGDVAADPDGYSVSCEVYYTSKTKSKILNPDNTPKTATAYVSATQVKKIRTAEGAEGYQVGIGIPAAEGNTYATGMGAAPADVALSAENKAGTFDKDGKTYDAFYFTVPATFSGQQGYVVVKNAAGNESVYTIDLSDVYTDQELSRGIYEVENLACDTGMINLDSADAKTYIKVDNGQAYLLVRIYNANKYDYIYPADTATRPDPAATDTLIKGTPIPADAAYLANGVKKSQVFTDTEGVLGAKGMKYKAMYFELPITQADIAAKQVTISVRRAPWGPSKPGQWMGDDNHYLTFTGYKEVADDNGLVDATIADADIQAAVEATNKIPYEPTADDMAAYAEGMKAYGELDYSQSDINRLYLDFAIPEIAKKLADADEAIPNIVPADGTYVFLQTLESFNYPSVAEGLYSDSLYSGVLVVENGKMTVTVAQRRGTYEYMFLGYPTQAAAAFAAAGKDFTKTEGAISFQNEDTVYLDHPMNTIGPDGDHSTDVPGLYGMYTATYEIGSLEKPVMISCISGASSSWYNRSFTFHKANMFKVDVSTAIRAINMLLNSPDPDNPENIYQPYRVDPALVTAEDADSIAAAAAAYDALDADGKAQLAELPVIGTPEGVNDAQTYTEALAAAQEYDLSEGSIELAAASLPYTGKALEPVATVKSASGKELVANTDYTLVYANNTNVGTATVTATGMGAYSGEIAATFEIAKAAQTITASNKSVAMGKTVKIGAKTNGDGKLTYKSSNTKIAKVSAAGVVTPVKAGKATITITASETANYAKATKTITVTVKQGKQTVTFKNQSKTGKAGKTVAITPAKAKTAVTYKITKAVKGKKSVKGFTINKKTGKIAIKKNVAKGTYKVTVKASAKATASWKAANKSAVITIKVK